MKKIIFFFSLTLVSGLLQVTLLENIKIFGIKPDILLISILLASLNFTLRWALAVSLFAGFLKDVFCAWGFGINSLLFALWSFLTFKLASKVTMDTDIAKVVLVFVVSILHNSVMSLFSIGSGNPVSAAILSNIIIQSIYTAAVYPLFSLITRPLETFDLA